MDGAGNMRDMRGFTFIDKTLMTVDLCYSYCSRYNYMYFGVQWSFMCSCDNQVNSDSLFNQISFV